MTALLFGLAALVMAIIAWRLKSGVRWRLRLPSWRTSVGVVLLAASVVLALRSNISAAVGLAMVALLVLERRGLGRLDPSKWGRPQPGSTSRVVTDYLDVEFDHDTGALRGRILQGAFAGREIDALTPAELAALWRDLSFADPQSAQIVEACLDRAHPTWRDDLARGGDGRGGESSSQGKPPEGGQMGVEEACAILGLAPGASPDEIRQAHRELMKKLHPDRGGSGYLAAKINEAKDTLLGRS